MNEYDAVEHKIDEAARKRTLIQYLIDHRQGFSLLASSKYQGMIPEADLVRDERSGEVVFSPREKRS